MRRLTEIRCVPLSLRGRVVDGIFMAALEQTTNLPERMLVGKLLSSLVPAGIVTRAQLIAGVTEVMSSFAELKTDFPKADVQLADLCGLGLVQGTLKEAAFSPMGMPPHDAAACATFGYVPVGLIAAPVAERMSGVDTKKAGLLLPQPEEDVDDENDVNDKAKATIAAAAAVKVVETKMAVNNNIVAAPEKSGDDDEDDDDFQAATTKKKKKKASKALVEEEEDNININE